MGMYKGAIFVLLIVAGVLTLAYVGVSGIYHSLYLEHMHGAQNDLEDDVSDMLHYMTLRFDNLTQQHMELMGQHQYLMQQHEQLMLQHQTLHTDHENLALHHEGLSADHEGLHDDHDELKAEHAALNAQNTNILAQTLTLLQLARDVDAMCPVANDCEVGMATSGACDGVTYKHPGEACESTDQCYYDDVACDGKGGCVGQQCKGDCATAACPILGLGGSNALVGDYVRDPECTVNDKICTYEVGNEKEGAQQGIHPDLVATYDGLYAANATTYSSTVTGFSCTTTQKWVDRCLAIIPESMRDCMVVEPVCVEGVVLEALPEQELRGPVWSRCVARFACANSEVPFVI